MKTKRKGEYICRVCKGVPLKRYVRFNSLLKHFTKTHKRNFCNEKEIPKLGKDYCVELFPKNKPKKTKEPFEDVVNRRLENLELSITGFNSRLNCLIGDLRSKANAIDRTLAALNDPKDKAGVKDVPKPVKTRNNGIAFLDDLAIAPPELHKATAAILDDMLLRCTKEETIRFANNPNFENLASLTSQIKAAEEIRRNYREAAYVLNDKGEVVKYKGNPFTKKSHIIEEVAKEKGIPVEEHKPAECEPEDFKGLMLIFDDEFANIMQFAKHLMADEALMLLRKCVTKNPDLSMHPAFVDCVCKLSKDNKNFFHNWLDLNPPSHD